MKDRFEIGEKVRIVCAEYLIKNFKTSTSLEIGSYYTTDIDNKAYYVTPSMLKYLGKTVTIANKTPGGNYNIIEDNGLWRWNEVILRKLDEDDFNDLGFFKSKHVGNIIKEFCDSYCILDCQEDCPLFRFKKIRNLEILINDEA